MRFSVITVCFNNLAGLIATHESLVAQSSTDFEWIVIDGGSSDGTVSYLEKLSLSNLSWISEKDNGIFDAMNKGIERASGEFCIFMNAGDRFFDGFVLKSVADAIGEKKPSIVYGDAAEVGNDKVLVKPARNPKANFYVMFTHHQAIFYLRETLGAGYDLSYRFSGDWALTTRLLRRPTANLLYYPNIVCLFERGGVSQSELHRTQINAEHWRIYREETGMNYCVALALWSIKVQTNTLRRIFPEVYDWMRYARPN